MIKPPANGNIWTACTFWWQPASVLGILCKKSQFWCELALCLKELKLSQFPPSPMYCYICHHDEDWKPFGRVKKNSASCARSNMVTPAITKSTEAAYLSLWAELTQHAELFDERSTMLLPLCWQAQQPLCTVVHYCLQPTTMQHDYHQQLATDHSATMISISNLQPTTVQPWFPSATCSRQQCNHGFQSATMIIISSLQPTTV